ncbi:hypothetical protein GO639_05210 [Staphylococcus aureus]|nr:hypothetical protein [Staphylococcus aureus]
MKKAEQARESLIPSKSEAVYQKEYKIYLDWLTRKNVMPKDVTETVFLAYFQELVRNFLCFSVDLVVIVFIRFSQKRIVRILYGLNGQC